MIDTFLIEPQNNYPNRMDDTLLKFVNKIYRCSITVSSNDKPDKSSKVYNYTEKKTHYDRIPDLCIAKMYLNSKKDLPFHKSNLYYLLQKGKISLVKEYYTSDHQATRFTRNIDFFMYIYNNPKTVLIDKIHMLTNTINEDNFLKYICQEYNLDYTLKCREILFWELQKVRVNLLTLLPRKDSYEYTLIKDIENHLLKLFTDEFTHTLEDARALVSVIQHSDSNLYIEQQLTLLSTRNPKSPQVGDIIIDCYTKRNTELLIQIIRTNMDLVVKLRNNTRGCAILTNTLIYLKRVLNDQKRDARVQLYIQLLHLSANYLTRLYIKNESQFCQLIYTHREGMKSECVICLERYEELEKVIVCRNCVDSSIHFKCFKRMGSTRCVLCRQEGKVYILY